MNGRHDWKGLCLACLVVLGTHRMVLADQILEIIKELRADLKTLETSTDQRVYFQAAERLRELRVAFLGSSKDSPNLVDTTRYALRLYAIASRQGIQSPAKVGLANVHRESDLVWNLLASRVIQGPYRSGMDPRKLTSDPEILKSIEEARIADSKEYEQIRLEGVCRDICQTLPRTVILPLSHQCFDFKTMEGREGFARIMREEIADDSARTALENHLRELDKIFQVQPSGHLMEKSEK